MVGPQDGGDVFGWTILPRANDTAMPHVWEMLSRLRATRERRGVDRSIAVVVLQGAWFTFRLALAGFALGAVVGFGLAVADGALQGRRAGAAAVPRAVADRAADRARAAGRQLGRQARTSAAFEWPRWLSAAVLGAFLAFFPVAVGTLRGLTSAPPRLARADGLATPRRGARRCSSCGSPRPCRTWSPRSSSAATASVVGVVVAEISTGLAGGIGRLIIEYAREATERPGEGVHGGVRRGRARAR